MYSIVETEDGGLVVAGYTRSKGKGKRDVRVFKLNKKGEMVWEKVLGGKHYDEAMAIRKTKDGGFIVAGFTASKSNGKNDFWVIKLDKDEDVVWDKNYGGKKADQANAIIETSDGGYVVAGFTLSKGAGHKDAWIIKLDKDGNIVWKRVYGTEKWDEAKAVVETKDGGYLVAGFTMSKGARWGDILILKLDKNGNVVFDKHYGGKFVEDMGYGSMTMTRNGDVVIAGFTSSKGNGMDDVYLIKVDSNGNLVWEKAYGGVKVDRAFSIDLTKDGGFIVGGITKSRGKGEEDAWILKLNGDGNL